MIKKDMNKVLNKYSQFAGLPPKESTDKDSSKKSSSVSIESALDAIVSTLKFLFLPMSREQRKAILLSKYNKSGKK